MKHRRVFTTLQGESEDFAALVRFLTKTSEATDDLNRTVASHVESLAQAVQMGSTDPPERQSGAYALADSDFIEWVADRLVYRGDRDHADFVLRLRRIAAFFRDEDAAREQEGWHGVIRQPKPKSYGGGSSSIDIEAETVAYGEATLGKSRFSSSVKGRFFFDLPEGVKMHEHVLPFTPNLEDPKRHVVVEVEARTVHGAHRAIEQTFEAFANAYNKEDRAS